MLRRHRGDRFFKRVSIIGSEVSAGQQYYGTEEAPMAIISRIAREPEWTQAPTTGSAQWKDVHLHLDFVKEANLFVPTDEGQTGAHCLDVLGRTLRQTADKVEQAARMESKILSLGGDHSVAMGSIEGARRVLGENLLVLWIDAHGDFNTPERTPSGNVHGMPLAALCGAFSFAGAQWSWLTGSLSGAQVIHAGGRAFDRDEAAIMNSFGIDIVDMAQVRKRPLAHLAERVLQTLARDPSKRLWVSFDVDAISSEHTPGTGTPEPDGLSPDECRGLVRRLTASPQCLGMEVVELNPKLDTRDLVTTALAAELAMEALDGFSEAREAMHQIPDDLETAS